MKRVAFITYNTVGDNLKSGWHRANGRRALVLQNTKGEHWAVPKGASKDVPGHDRGGVRRRVEIDALWKKLQKIASRLDHVVIYVGAEGAERAIHLAGELLPAAKVTFVHCNCHLQYKEGVIQAAGFSGARRILCECGGHWTLKKLYSNFMGTGELWLV